MTKDFHTSDTALAAYLVISGVRLVKLDTGINPAEYTFGDSTQDIGDLIVRWEQGRIDCARFYRAYRRFIAQIKEAHNAR